MKKQNEKIIYCEENFSDTGQAHYKNNRKNYFYLRINKVSRRFLTKFTKEMKKKIRIHYVESYVKRYEKVCEN